MDIVNVGVIFQYEQLRSQGPQQSIHINNKEEFFLDDFGNIYIKFYLWQSESMKYDISVNSQI